MKSINTKEFFEGFDLKYIILLFPYWLELIDFQNYEIRISGSPYSLGMISFIVFGISQLQIQKYSKNQGSISLLIILISFFIGSFFGQKLGESISRAFGMIPILLAIVGLSRIFFNHWFLRFLDAFMVLTFCKWSLYVITLTFVGGTISSYSELYDSVDKVSNHHIPGLYISITSAYIINRFFRGESNYKIWGFVIFGLSLILSIILESRSNFIFIIINFTVGLIFLGQKVMKVGVIGFLTFCSINLLFYFLFSDFDFILQRFDTSDSEYLEKTNRGRTEAYEMFWPTVLQYPLGKGLRDIYIDIGGDSPLLMHNQYATFAIAGGFLAMFGTLILLMYFIKVALRIFKVDKLNKIEPADLGIFFSSLIYVLTITTIDLFGGLVSNLMFSMIIYLGQKFLPNGKSHFNLTVQQNP